MADYRTRAATVADVPMSAVSNLPSAGKMVIEVSGRTQQFRKAVLLPLLLLHLAKQRNQRSQRGMPPQANMFHMHCCYDIMTLSVHSHIQVLHDRHAGCCLPDLAQATSADVALNLTKRCSFRSSCTAAISCCLLSVNICWQRVRGLNLPLLGASLCVLLMLLDWCSNSRLSDCCGCS